MELTSQYVVGGGIDIGSSHPPTEEFIRQWWNQPLNRMDVRCGEWCDELARSGELFVVISHRRGWHELPAGGTGGAHQGDHQRGE